MKGCKPFLSAKLEVYLDGSHVCIHPEEDGSLDGIQRFKLLELVFESIEDAGPRAGVLWPEAEKADDLKRLGHLETALKRGKRIVRDRIREIERLQPQRRSDA